MASWQNYLKNIYYNPSKPASLSGPDKLYQYVKKDGKYDVSKYKIRKWLQNEEPYSLQRPYRRPKNRTAIIVAGIDDQWSADLMDMVKFAKYNKDYTYVLVVIDVFSKFVWLRELKDKKGSSVSEAFKSIFEEGRKPNRIRTDKGQEFKAKPVQALFKQNNIQHFYAENEVKASVAERAIKTIKTKMYRYFTYKQSYEYVSKLQNFAEGYNHTVHSTIDMAPADVTEANAEEVRLATYFSRQSGRKTAKHLRFKFKVGDHVRITHLRNIFTREYDERWTGEIFTVSKRFWRNSTPIYILSDFYNQETLKGTFYQSQLQKVDLSDDDMFKVETILKSRGKGRNKQYYVKWLYWPKKYSSWVKDSDVHDI